MQHIWQKQEVVGSFANVPAKQQGGVYLESWRTMMPHTGWSDKVTSVSKIWV
jgi:hypothetical protein